MKQAENFSNEESLDIISQMIKKAKNSFLDDGFGPMLWGFTVVFCAILQIIFIANNIYGGFKNPWLLTFVAGLIQINYNIKQGKKKLAKSWNDTAMLYIWSAFAITMLLGTFIKPWAEGLFFPGKGSNSIDSFSIFLLYGTPTFITGGIMKFKPMFYGGIVCFLCAFLSLFINKAAYTNLITQSHAGYLLLTLTAISAAFAWLVPGIILRLKFNKAKAAQHEHV